MRSFIEAIEDPVKMFRRILDGYRSQGGTTTREDDDAAIRQFARELLSKQRSSTQRGEHLSGDLTEALRIIKRLADIVSATPKEAFKDWSMGSPYDVAREAEAFIAKPRSVFAPSATGAGDFTAARIDYIESRAKSGATAPTREELAGFHDGWHAAQSQRSATGATIERLRALVKKIDDEPMRLPRELVVADEMRAILDSTDSGSQ